MMENTARGSIDVSKLIRSKKRITRAITRYSYIVFGNLAEKILSMPFFFSYNQTLKKAYPGLYPPAVLSFFIFFMLLVPTLVTAVFGVLSIFVGIHAQVVAIIIIAIIIIELIIIFMPHIIVYSRAKRIDRELPYAASFLAMLAQSGMTIGDMFRILAGEKEIFPEMSKEAERIYRDIDVLGHSPISVLSAASRDAPSPKLDEFYRGITATIYSGGNLTSYLLAKAEQYAFELKQIYEREIQGLETLMESYVVIAVALPVFFTVIVIAMSFTTGAFGDPVLLLKLLLYVALPIAHAVYFYMVYDTFRRK